MNWIRPSTNWIGCGGMSRTSVVLAATMALFGPIDLKNSPDRTLVGTGGAAGGESRPGRGTDAGASDDRVPGEVFGDSGAFVQGRRPRRGTSACVRAARTSKRPCGPSRQRARRPSRGGGSSARGGCGPSGHGLPRRDAGQGQTGWGSPAGTGHRRRQPRPGGSHGHHRGR